MGIKGKVNTDAREEARINRERQTNPVDVEPGMDDGIGGNGMANSNDPWGTGGDSDPWGTGSSGGGASDPWGTGSGGGASDPWGTTSSSSDPWGSPSGGSDPWGTSTNNGAWGASNNTGMDMFGQPTQSGEPKKEAEDVFFETVGKVCKGFFTFFKDFSGSFSDFDVARRLTMGRASFIAGIIVAILGLVLILLSMGGGLGLGCLVGGLLSAGVGAPLFMFSVDSIRKNGVPDRPEPTTSVENNDALGVTNDNPFGNDTGGWGVSDDTSKDDSGWDSWGESPKEESEGTEWGTDDWGDDDEEEDDEDDDDWGSPIVNGVTNESSKQAMEQNLENLDNNNGMFTRKFLFDKYISVLPNVLPDYNREIIIEQDSTEFDDWDAIVQQSAEIFKTSDKQELPYLVEAKDKTFYILLVVQRQSWLKNIDNLVNEIVNIYRADENGNMDMNIYGTGHTVGDKVYIKIMKSDNCMVSLGDIYSTHESEIVDIKNGIPVVLGLDIEGEPVIVDFLNLNSILVTGMPRSGKSWLIQSVMTQMTMYKKPSELQFYILDPKDKISDFYQMEIPHIRKFVSSDSEILKELRNIVKVEGPRRKKQMGDAGFVNINDYKKANPDLEMPYLYVMIDEVITLSERMDKDTKDEFQGLLMELVSQLPALGIRIMMIPHLVKDKILKKSITDLIPCRVSVRGDVEHIEGSLGVRNFPHALRNQGDMAIKLNNDKAMYVHASILTDSNTGNMELISYMRKLWGKLEPEMMEGSVYNKRHNIIGGTKGKEIDSLLTSFEEKVKTNETEPKVPLNKQSSNGWYDSSEEVDIFSNDTLFSNEPIKAKNTQDSVWANPVGREQPIESFDIEEEGEEELDIFSGSNEKKPLVSVTKTMSKDTTRNKVVVSEIEDTENTLEMTKTFRNTSNKPVTTNPFDIVGKENVVENTSRTTSSGDNDVWNTSLEDEVSIWGTEDSNTKNKKDTDSIDDLDIWGQ